MYVVSKNEQGEYTGFCSKTEFEKHPDLFHLIGETVEEFEGPDFDGEEATFAVVRALAEARCSK